MSYFAKVKNEIVEQVIVADQEFIDALPAEEGVEWVETDYEMNGGVHKKGGQPLRKNYAGIGYKFDKARDMFIPKKPFDSWVLDEEKGKYKAPKERPKDADGNDEIDYVWNEQKLKWEKRQNVEEPA